MKQLTDEQIDVYLDGVLRASGSALRHYSMQKSLDDMRAAVRAIESEVLRINGITGEAQPARYQPTAQEVKELRSAFSKTHRRWDGEETACARLMDCQEALIKHGNDQLLALGELRVMYAPKATAQPAREWVGLTDEERLHFVSEILDYGAGFIAPIDAVVCNVESKLREKNAGQPAAMKPWQTMPTVKDRATNRELPVTGVYEDVVFVDVPAADDKSGGYEKALEIRTAQGWKLTGEAIPVLYTDSINGQQVCRDDVWLCTTAALRKEDDKAGGEPVAWRELCRRLYVELFHCDQQMTSGPRPKWTQGATVRDVLRDAKEALETHPQPQAEAVSPDKAQNFYLAVCNFLVWIGREGIVHADDPIIDQLSNALHDIDGGVFKDSLKWPQADVRVPDGYALVPVEPTDDMLHCAQDRVYSLFLVDARNIWDAMLSAVPKPQEDLPAILKKQAS